VRTFWGASALALVLLPAPVQAGAVGPFWETLSTELPAKEGGLCEPGDLGELAAIAGTEEQSMVTVIGFRRAAPAGACCRTLHYVHVVLSDPDPPRRAGAPDKPPVKPPYVAPLRGGSLRGKALVAGDDLPWFDGEAADQAAGDTGEFGGEGHNLARARGWSRDTRLERVYGERVAALKPGLEYATLLVCSDGKRLAPVGGVFWGMSADGPAHLDWPRSGRALWKQLPAAQLEEALARAGFEGYEVTERPCACSDDGAPVGKPPGKGKGKGKGKAKAKAKAR
jgi:hypothetical protein